MDELRQFVSDAMDLVAMCATSECGGGGGIIIIMRYVGVNLCYYVRLKC